MGDQLEFPFPQNPRPKNPLKVKLRQLASRVTALARLIWRNKIFALLGSVGSFAAIAFASNLINAQIACSINFAQPVASDMCAYFGLGDKPRRKERIAWEALSDTLKTPSSENCQALQKHIRTFSNGAYRTTADQLLTSAIKQQKTSWAPQTRELPIFVAIAESGSSTRTEAENDVRSRAQKRAAQQCHGYSQDENWRVQSSSIGDEELRCDISGALHYCSLEGTTFCGLEKRSVEQIELCGTDASD